jgi:hypothetical protein
MLKIDANPLPDLQQILRAIEPEVQGLEWRLLDLREAVQPEPPSDELERIIDAPDQAEGGLVRTSAGFSIRDLCEQIVGGLFVGLSPVPSPLDGRIPTAASWKCLKSWWPYSTAPSGRWQARTPSSRVPDTPFRLRRT